MRQYHLTTCLLVALLVYVCGILAVYAKKWDYLFATLLSVKVSKPYATKPTLLINILIEKLFQPSEYAPLGEVIKVAISPSLKKYIANDDLEQSFNLLEMIIAVCHCATRDTESAGIHFYHKSHSQETIEVIKDFWYERGAERENWQFIKDRGTLSRITLEVSISEYEGYIAQTLGIMNPDQYIKKYKAGYEKSLYG